MLPFLGGAEEQVKRLRKDQRVLVAGDKNGSQRHVDIGAVADLDQLQQHRVDDSAGPIGMLSSCTQGSRRCCRAMLPAGEGGDDRHRLPGLRQAHQFARRFLQTMCGGSP